MQIGVVADTHGHREFTMNAVRMLSSLGVDQVIHCGDVGSAELLELFGQWPLHVVRGNVDRDAQLKASAAELSTCTYHGDFGELALVDHRIAFLHGDDQSRLESTIESGDWDLVCHGHTHVARRERVGTIFVLNPGAVYRARQQSIAVVQLLPLEATIVPI